MYQGRLFIALTIGLVSSVFRADGDLKAVFAFNERVVSMVFPAFNYGIMTTVDQGSRQIAISFPVQPVSGSDDVTTPHMEITLEALGGSVDGMDYYEHYLDRYRDAMGTTDANGADRKLTSLALKAYHAIHLRYTDGALKPHTMLMITAIDEGTGIVIVLDVLAEAYEAMEAVVTGILESFRFEN